MSLEGEGERERERERVLWGEIKGKLCMSMCAFVHLQHIQLATYQSNQRWH